MVLGQNKVLAPSGPNMAPKNQEMRELSTQGLAGLRRSPLVSRTEPPTSISNPGPSGLGAKEWSPGL